MKELTAFDGTANDTPDTCSDGRRQDNEAQWPVLCLWLIHVCNKTKRHTATSSREAALVKLVLEPLILI